MAKSKETDRWLPQFRRSLSYLGVHRRLLIIGLVSAIGVSVSYTFSISTIVPILKIIFADHETVVDWLHRTESARRLGVYLVPDLPDDPAGLRIHRLALDSPAGEHLREGDTISGVDGQPCSSHAVMQAIAQAPADQLGASIRAPNGTIRPAKLPLAGYRWWWKYLQSIAGLLPAGRDAHSRLLTLAVVMGLLVLVALLGGVCRFVNDGLICTAVQRAMHGLRTQVADHVLRLPMSWHSQQPPGDTLARLATDIGKVEVGQTTLFGKVVREPLKAIGVLSLTMLIEWRLLLIAVVGLPVGVLLLRLFGRLVKRAQRRASQSWGRLLDHLGERLSGIRVVKACNAEDVEHDRLDREGRNLTRAQTHIELVDAATKPVLETLAMLAIAAFVLYGGMRVFQQKLEPHLFFAAVVCLAGVFDPVRKLGNVNNRLQAAEASARRLFELLDRPTEEPASPPTRRRQELPPFEHAIEFCDVSFTYPSSPRPVLQNISLRVAKGQAVALVGPNGSGKTTLISLLLRFFEPGSGCIRIDGHDLADVTLESLRAQIGLVTQEAVVFSGTLRENIAYGLDGLAEERIRQAARRAHVDEFARELRVENNGQVSCGYDAYVSARTLSGGQRQRIALARAILRDPPIMILDEATSQVDSESERKIQEAFGDVMVNRTTFIIAHRYSTIAQANRIVVLNEGRIVGCGTHDELLNSCPFYVSLCKTQFAHRT